MANEIGKVTKVEVYGVELKPETPAGAVVGRGGIKSNVVIFKIGNKLQAFDLQPLSPGLPDWALEQLEDQLGITEAKEAASKQQETAKQV